MKTHSKLLMSAFFLLLILFTAFTGTIQAQKHTQEVVYHDSLANSQTLAITYSVINKDKFVVNDLDSVVLSYYAYGAINFDSVNVAFGITQDCHLPRITHQDSTLSYYQAITSSLSKTVAVSLTNAQESYTAKAIAIPKSSLGGYNQLKFTFYGHSTGNTPSATQKLIAIVDKYFTH